MAVAKRVITIPDDLDPVTALGPGDSVLAEVEHAFPKVDIFVRGNRIELAAYSARDDAEADRAAGVLEDIIEEAYKAPVEASVVRRMLERDSVGRGHGHRLQHDDAGFGANRRSLASHGSHYAVVSGDYGHAKEKDSNAENDFADSSNMSIEGASQDPVDRAYPANSASAPSATLLQRVHHGRHAAQPADAPNTTSDFGYTAKSVQPVPTVTTSTHRTRIPGIITMAAGEPVRAKTAGQVAYVGAIEEHTITFGIGPAGTGKTYLAVAKAVRAFEDGRVSRIILTRPAVEAGESLGFLPGTLNDKVDPYLRPLYDALSDMLGAAQLHRYMNDGSIEVAPLAYMRGRTLNDAFVILDEAQNTTEQQMKMFLTRLGFNTTMVITGDVTQVDLGVRHSGLGTIECILTGIDDIAFIHLTERDVVRHALVGRIVAAYNDHDEQVACHRENRHRMVSAVDVEKQDNGKIGKSDKKKHKKDKKKRRISEDGTGNAGAFKSSRSNAEQDSPAQTVFPDGSSVLSEAYGAGSFNEGQGSMSTNSDQNDEPLAGIDVYRSGNDDIEEFDQ